jgi:tRNA modification GTPase
VIVVNKIDLTNLGPSRRSTDSVVEVQVSAKTGAGMSLVRDIILEAAGWVPQEEGVFLARARHVDALGQAAEHLRLAEDCYGQLELFAEELRLAQTAIARITGEFTADDLLGEIFSRFCIGK